MATSATTPPINVVIGNLTFVAVPLEQATFTEKGSIHVIFELDKEGAATVLDVGQSAESGVDQFYTPERRAQWVSRAQGRSIWVGTYMEPVEKLFSRARNAAEDRAQIVARLREEY